MTWYTGNVVYDTLLLLGFAYALAIFISSQMGTAQYGGRFGNNDRGIKFSSKVGWILMETPALILFPLFFFMGSNSDQAVPLFFLAVWIFHYTNRAWVTPSLMRTRPDAKKTFDLSVVIAGWVTLALHSYLNARFISEYGEHYQADWFSDPRFIIGMIVYIMGFLLNIQSDSIQRNLRSKTPSADEPRYKIPFGGGFKFVTCPQYLGEMMAFLGFAIMTWNLGALFVLATTMANLIPRALYTHKWFKKNFPEEYPADRKAVIPYIL